MIRGRRQYGTLVKNRTPPEFVHADGREADLRAAGPGGDIDRCQAAVDPRPEPPRETGIEPLAPAAMGTRYDEPGVCEYSHEARTARRESQHSHERSSESDSAVH